MTKYYCDRCGKEITSRSSVLSVLGSFCSDKNFSKDSNFGYDLCPECAVSFRHWVENMDKPDMSTIEKNPSDECLCRTCVY